MYEYNILRNNSKKINRKVIAWKTLCLQTDKNDNDDDIPLIQYTLSW